MKTLRTSKKFRIYKSARRELGTKFPAAFPHTGKRPPLKIGIFDDIRSHGGVSVPLSHCRLFLRIWTNSTAYLRNFETGRERVGLHGEVSGDVLDRHAVEARSCILERKKRRATIDMTRDTGIRSLST